MKMVEKLHENVLTARTYLYDRTYLTYLLVFIINKLDYIFKRIAL
jgi:hypothetical protein